MDGLVAWTRRKKSRAAPATRQIASRGVHGLCPVVLVSCIIVQSFESEFGFHYEVFYYRFTFWMVSCRKVSFTCKESYILESILYYKGSYIIRDHIL